MEDMQQYAMPERFLWLEGVAMLEAVLNIQRLCRRSLKLSTTSTHDGSNGCPASRRNGPCGLRTAKF